MMRVYLTTLGPLRRIVGIDDEGIELVDGSTVGDAIDALIARHPDLSRHRDSILVAVDEEWSDRETVLKVGDRLILMPPVSGG